MSDEGSVVERFVEEIGGDCWVSLHLAGDDAEIAPRQHAELCVSTRFVATWSVVEFPFKYWGRELQMGLCTTETSKPLTFSQIGPVGVLGRVADGAIRCSPCYTLVFDDDGDDSRVKGLIKWEIAQILKYGGTEILEFREVEGDPGLFTVSVPDWWWAENRRRTNENWDMPKRPRGTPKGVLTPEEREAIREHAEAERDVDDWPPSPPGLMNRLAQMVAPAINELARKIAAENLQS